MSISYISSALPWSAVIINKSSSPINGNILSTQEVEEGNLEEADVDIEKVVLMFMCKRGEFSEKDLRNLYAKPHWSFFKGKQMLLSIGSEYHPRKL